LLPARDMYGIYAFGLYSILDVALVCVRLWNNKCLVDSDLF
jgi:hypothetical protein